jgi:hypothetical protein
MYADFTDSQCGWVVGSAVGDSRRCPSFLLQTTDGGDTWHQWILAGDSAEASVFTAHRNEDWLGTPSILEPPRP